MAGIGPIVNRPDSLRRHSYRNTSTLPKNELEIFLLLSVGRVCFQPQSNSLYFVDSPNLSITDIIQQVFKGLGQEPQIRQLYMDVHNLLKAAFCITLTPQQKKCLMVALNLNGIDIQTI